MVEEELLNPEEEIEFGADKAVEEERGEFETIDDGTYEVVLKTFEILNSKKLNDKGLPTKYMNITFVIRDDVDQKFKNRRIWHTIFARDNDKAFNFNEINKIIVTQEGRPDYKRRFKSLDEILQYLVGLHLRLDIGIEFNNFKGKEGNVIKEDSFKPSVWDTEPHDNPVNGEPGENPNNIGIEDSDLPF